MSASSPLPRFRAAGRTSAAMLSAFRRDGCLIIEDFVPAADCERLCARAKCLVEAFEPGRCAGVFSTRDGGRAHAAERYFRESGDKIRFFFEAEALRDGALRRPRSLAINKIGHALHDLDPDFAAFSRRPEHAELAAALGFVRPLLLQSMLIFKQPRIGEEVVCHQDSTFLYTEPLSCVGFWFALEDADLDNGCLWAIPGRQPLRRRFRYRGEELLTETLDDTPLPLDRARPLPAPRGTLIVLDGLLAHYSAANRSARSRLAYTLHLIDGTAHYPADNWLRRASGMPLRGFC